MRGRAHVLKPGIETAYRTRTYLEMSRAWVERNPEATVALLRALIEGDAGILSLSIERPGLHDAFVAIAGEAAARALEEVPEAPIERKARR
jgi:ABC-2 type transport system ATP-binding protein